MNSLPTFVLIGRPCVDCHAFEFMQRALQDLKKTAFNLDSRVRSHWDIWDIKTIECSLRDESDVLILMNYIFILDILMQWETMKHLFELYLLNLSF